MFKKGFSPVIAVILIGLVSLAVIGSAIFLRSKTIATASHASEEMATGQGWVANVKFPRLQSRHQFGSGFKADPKRFSKYDFIGFVSVPLDVNDIPLVDFTAEIKKYNPNARTRIYMNPDLIPENSDIWPGHYLFFAGSTLKKSINASTTTIELSSHPERFKKGTYAMFWDFTSRSDVEHVLIKKVVGNTLTVERAVKPNPNLSVSSTARPHKANVRIAMHVFNKTPERLVGNFSRQCETGKEGKVCGDSFKNFADFEAAKQTERIVKAKTDGLKVDNAFTYPYGILPLGYDQIDYDNDNEPDNADRFANNNPWANGMIYFYKALREKAGDRAILYGNNASLNPYLNGKFYQGWNIDKSHGGQLRPESWDETIRNYFLSFGSFDTPRFISTDPETVPNDFKTVRFTLTATLLGNGFFGNKGALGGVGVGPDTWYDEYDNGAGSVLVEDILSPDQNYLAIYPGTTTKFKVGDIIYLPQESLRVESIDPATNRLYVTRRFITAELQTILDKLGQKISDNFELSDTYSPEQSSKNDFTHQKGEKVMTMEQIYTNKGFLGNPTSQMSNQCLIKNFDPQNCLRYFDNGVALVNPTTLNQTYKLKDGNYFRINGMQDPTVNNGKKEGKMVNIPPQDGLILVRHQN